MLSKRFIFHHPIIIVLMVAMVLLACSGQKVESTATSTPNELDLTTTPTFVRLPENVISTLVATPNINETPYSTINQISSGKNASEYVVQLRVRRCVGLKPDEFQSLTGMFVSGKEGIITALHGVAGCQNEVSNGKICLSASVAKTWSATEKDKERRRDYSCLTILEADINRDVVHIYSEELVADRGNFWPQEGLDPVDPNNLRKPLDNWLCGETHQEEIRIYGFSGLSESGIPKLAHILCVRVLQELLTDVSRVPDTLLGNLIRRQSPNLDISVLHIGDNVLTPGDSGAPIMRNEDNSLYGVALGGVPGLSYVAWAVPWTQIDWKSVSNSAVSGRLRELAQERLDSAPSGDIFFGFAPNYNDDTADVPPAGTGVPYISISESRLWRGDLPAVVYTPEDACIVVLTDDFYASGKATITQMAINANEFDTNLSIGMTRLSNTPVSVYRNICNQLANQESVTLYAYLYERQGSTCVQPLSTVDGIVYNRFKLYAPADVWATGFCADSDIRSP